MRRPGATQLRAFCCRGRSPCLRGRNRSTCFRELTKRRRRGGGLAFISPVFVCRNRHFERWGAEEGSRRGFPGGLACSFHRFFPREAGDLHASSNRSRCFERLAGRGGCQAFISPAFPRETGVLHALSNRLRRFEHLDPYGRVQSFKSAYSLRRPLQSPAF